MSDLDGPRFAEDVLRDEDDFTHYFNATARLSAENKELRSTAERYREALEPFAFAAEAFEWVLPAQCATTFVWFFHAMEPDEQYRISVADLFIARAALSQTASEER